MVRLDTACQQSRRPGGEALLDVLVSCELRAVLSYFEKRTRKDFLAENFDAAYGTWLHPEEAPSS